MTMRWVVLLWIGLASSVGCASSPSPVDLVGERLAIEPVQAPPRTPLVFPLDPLDVSDSPASSGAMSVSVSRSLRGRRALVLVLASYDIGSLAALRLLGPMLSSLPADAGCALVALQPMADRPLVEQFFAAEPTPCRKAIGDASDGRLGDLARVRVLPSILALRPDGTLAGVVAGSFGVEDVRRILEAAAH